MTIFFFVSLFCHTTFALVHHSKLWINTTMIGAFSDKSLFKYYLEPKLRLFDAPNKLEEASLYLGPGYQITKNFLFILGDAFILGHDDAGNAYSENRLFQQTNWDLVHSKDLDLSNRTRLEFRKREDHLAYAIRLREQLKTKIPFKNSKKYSLVIADEVFLNFNHPTWVSNRFLAENRAFAGFGIQITKLTEVDVGYKNQYRFNTIDSISHLLNIDFHIKA